MKNFVIFGLSLIFVVGLIRAIVADSAPDYTKVNIKKYEAQIDSLNKASQYDFFYVSALDEAIDRTKNIKVKAALLSEIQSVQIRMMLNRSSMEVSWDMLRYLKGERY